jgi:DNA-binding NarL/FixJ family response regulator
MTKPLTPTACSGPAPAAISPSENPTKKIIVALRCILQGKIYLGPDAVQRLAGNRAANKIRSVEILSDREIEVFAMLGRGLGTRRIAAMLHVSPKTIHAYHARIKEKLQLRDSTELLREAIRWIEKVAEYPSRPNKTDYRSLHGVIDLSPRKLGYPYK